MHDLPERTLWRVGLLVDPLGFAPREGYQFSHRFDDADRRGWRTIYCAWNAETALREVLSDLRPNLAARARFLRRYGADAAEELPPSIVPTDWRSSNVLAPVRIVPEAGGRVLDLTDVTERLRLERRHAELLTEHGLPHLDLNEITTRRRGVTRRIASTAYDEENIGVIRYPSSIDGEPCFVVMEGRARLEPAGQLVPLTDPPPAALRRVADEWQLALEPAPAALARSAAG